MCDEKTCRMARTEDFVYSVIHLSMWLACPNPATGIKCGPRGVLRMRPRSSSPRREPRSLVSSGAPERWLDAGVAHHSDSIFQLYCCVKRRSEVSQKKQVLTLSIETVR